MNDTIDYFWFACSLTFVVSAVLFVLSEDELMALLNVACAALLWYAGVTDALR